MSVHTKSNKKSRAEMEKVALPPHALRDWPRYISVVIKATFHVSVAFPIIFTLLLLQFKRTPPPPPTPQLASHRLPPACDTAGRRIQINTHSEVTGLRCRSQTVIHLEAKISFTCLCVCVRARLSPCVCVSAFGGDEITHSKQPPDRWSTFTVCDW